MAARKRGLSIDFSVFEDFAAELEGLGGDLKEIFTDVMEQEGETVGEDTKEAVKKAYPPQVSPALPSPHSPLHRK